MEKIIWENLFSLEIPESWAVHEEDSLISLFDESNGVGVLQISFTKRTAPKVPTATEATELAADYAKQKGWDIPVDSLHILDIGGSPTSNLSVLEDQDGESNRWVVWHIMGNERVCFITYNCLEEDKLVEQKLCELVVGSFHWL